MVLRYTAFVLVLLNIVQHCETAVDRNGAFIGYSEKSGSGASIAQMELMPPSCVAIVREVLYPENTAAAERVADSLAPPTGSRSVRG